MDQMARAERNRRIAATYLEGVKTAQIAKEFQLGVATIRRILRQADVPFVVSTMEMRFWSKVRRGGPDECWIWIGGCTGKGHPSFGDGRSTYAYRTAWELTNGRKLPDGVQVRRTCRERKCVNPRHMVIVSPQSRPRQGQRGQGRNNQERRRPDSC